MREGRSATVGERRRRRSARVPAGPAQVGVRKRVILVWWPGFRPRRAGVTGGRRLACSLVE